jgi:hypothetical protein
VPSPAGVRDFEGNAPSGGGDYVVSESGGYVYWRFMARS